jgi:hypothetical protein
MPPGPYTVSLTRLRDRKCPRMDEREAVETSCSNSITFTSLEEFSVYMATVSIGTSTRAASKEFTTLSAGMYKAVITAVVVIIPLQLPLELHVM